MPTYQGDLLAPLVRSSPVGLSSFDCFVLSLGSGKQLSPLPGCLGTWYPLQSFTPQSIIRGNRYFPPKRL